MAETYHPVARDFVTDVFGRNGCALYAEALGRSRSSLSRVMGKHSRTAALVIVTCELFRQAAGQGLYPEVLLRRDPPEVRLARGETYVSHAFARLLGERAVAVVADATGQTMRSVAGAIANEGSRFYDHYLRMVIVLDALIETGLDAALALTTSRDRRLAWQAAA